MLFVGFCTAAQEPGRYDVVIHEIFADPTPSRGMPAYEFIELHNTSRHAWDMKGWSVKTSGATGKINLSFVLEPDSTVILSGSSGSREYQSWGATVQVTGFPALRNDGDTIALLAPGGKTVHGVLWNKDWYGNEVKSDGGWSIEMIDLSKPCLGAANWKASVDVSGGTPGRSNSVAGMVTDTSTLQVMQAYWVNDQRIVLQLTGAPGIGSPTPTIRTEPALNITTLTEIPPLFDAIALDLTDPFRGTAVRIEVSGLKGCGGQASTPQIISAVSFSSPEQGDLVINEILFDPPDGGTDYVELYNRSEKAFDLSGVQIANRDGNNRISSIKALTGSVYALLPGEYVVLSADPAWIARSYRPPPESRMLLHRSLPTFPDDKGEVILLNSNAAILDELNYDARWHFELVSDRKGRSLERINTEGLTNDPYNWHTASTTSGNGTPGYPNSQTLPRNMGLPSPLTFSSRLISPDMDGRDDLLMIQYQFPLPGVVANITAFDNRGRPIKYIARNSICGTSGSFKWDGLDQAGTRLPAGIYIILTETFDLTGRTRQYRNTVGVVRPP